ncbi:MAG: hypothetical protein M3Y09_16215 [Actinomycetota bacterium]|nr:hypothetical protein [Actinomycetota bacterium]
MQFAATGERSGWQERPELGHQGAQRGVSGGRRAVWPERIDQLVATDVALPV